MGNSNSKNETIHINILYEYRRRIRYISTILFNEWNDLNKKSTQILTDTGVAFINSIARTIDSYSLHLRSEIGTNQTKRDLMKTVNNDIKIIKNIYHERLTSEFNINDNISGGYCYGISKSKFNKDFDKFIELSNWKQANQPPYSQNILSLKEIIKIIKKKTRVINKGFRRADRLV